MDNVRYAVIGAGAIAQRRHLPEIQANARAQLVGVCDVQRDRAEQIAGHYETQPYTDHRKMIEQSGCDAVVVATPNALHCPQTLDAFSAGKHVLVEKPMATTADEARQMIAAGKKAKRRLMIGMNQRLMPPHVKARQILDSGRLGRVLTFETNFKHAGPEGWSVDGASSWFFDKKQAVLGVTGDLGIHKADLMRYLLGAEFTHVGGFIETLDKRVNGRKIALDDNAFLTLRSGTGVIGSIHIAWTNYGGVEDNGTLLYCEKGAMRVGMDGEYGVMVDLADGSKERYMVGAVATNEKQVSSGVIDLFNEAILNDTAPEISGDEGYRALMVILTAMEAAEKGEILKIKY